MPLKVYRLQRFQDPYLVKLVPVQPIMSALATNCIRLNGNEVVDDMSKVLKIYLMYVIVPTEMLSYLPI